MGGSEKLMRSEVVVVGAGPIGSFCAARLASAGMDVTILEEHDEVGRPVQCTGLISPRVQEMISTHLPSSFGGSGRYPVQMEMRGARVHSPSTEHVVDFCVEDVKAHVVDRRVFDQGLFLAAVDAGATPHLHSRVDRVIPPSPSKGTIGASVEYVDHSGHHTIEADLVIGADGPGSMTARSLGLPPVTETLSGFQAEGTHTGPGLDQQVAIYSGPRVAPNYFAWAVPVSPGKVRVGCCMHDVDSLPLGTPKSPQAAFQNLVALPAFSDSFRGFSPTVLQAGTIPIGVRKRYTMDSVALVGDAAGMAKPTSGGGIYTGLVAGGILCDTLLGVGSGSKGPHAERTSKGAKGSSKGVRFPGAILERYSKAFDRDMGKDLRRGMLIHRTFMHMPPDDMERMFSLISEPGITALIREAGDIDHPTGLVLRMLREEPRFARYGKRFIAEMTRLKLGL